MVNLTDERQRTETLQRMLCRMAAAWGDPSLCVSVSGSWNGETEAAVRAFQQKESMPVTGICGRETWDAMVAACAGIDESEAPVYLLIREAGHTLGPGDEGDAVAQLQIVLRGLSMSYAFPPVPLDGCWGAGTEGAVLAFQRAAGLPQTGKADRRTWQALAEAYN